MLSAANPSLPPLTCVEYPPRTHPIEKEVPPMQPNRRTFLTQVGAATIAASVINVDVHAASGSNQRANECAKLRRDAALAGLQATPAGEEIKIESSYQCVIRRWKGVRICAPHGCRAEIQTAARLNDHLLSRCAGHSCTGAVFLRIRSDNK